MTSILKVDTIQDADGNNIINESSNTITIGASGDTLQASSGTTNNLGISEIDQWRLSADLSITTLNTLTNITANWERNDNTGFGRVGTGMTESSGTFTFPSTGIYLITTTFVFYSIYH